MEKQAKKATRTSEKQKRNKQKRRLRTQSEVRTSIVRGRWFIVIKKATRQQFYGMLTGSVIIESAQTDDHHIYDAKLMLFVSNNK